MQSAHNCLYRALLKPDVMHGFDTEVGPEGALVEPSLWFLETQFQKLHRQFHVRPCPT